MYEYIKGKITIITPKYIVIENNGVGYNVKTPNPYNYELDSTVTVYTYLHVREDVFELYGFSSLSERDFFLSLISVKGIGPKGALAILASGKTEETINAIKESNSRYLEKFPGIGAKASQQIILDLNGKLNFEERKTQLKLDPKVEDVKDALKNLGYKQAEIKKIEPVIEANVNEPMNSLIKIALKALLTI